MSRSGAFTPAYDARGLSARNSAPKAVTIARNNTTSHMSLGGMALRKGREGVVKEDATFAYNNVYGSLYEGKDTKSQMVAGSLVPEADGNSFMFDSCYGSQHEGKDTEGNLALSTLVPVSGAAFEPNKTNFDGFTTRNHFARGSMIPAEKLVYGGYAPDEWQKAREAKPVVIGNDGKYGMKLGAEKSRTYQLAIDSLRRRKKKHTQQMSEKFPAKSLLGDHQWTRRPKNDVRKYTTGAGACMQWSQSEGSAQFLERVVDPTYPDLIHYHRNVARTQPFRAIDPWGPHSRKAVRSKKPLRRSSSFTHTPRSQHNNKQNRGDNNGSGRSIDGQSTAAVVQRGMKTIGARPMTSSSVVRSSRKKLSGKSHPRNNFTPEATSGSSFRWWKSHHLSPSVAASAPAHASTRGLYTAEVKRKRNCTINNPSSASRLSTASHSGFQSPCCHFDNTMIHRKKRHHRKAAKTAKAAKAAKAAKSRTLRSVKEQQHHNTHNTNGELEADLFARPYSTMGFEKEQKISAYRALTKRSLGIKSHLVGYGGHVPGQRFLHGKNKFKLSEMAMAAAITRRAVTPQPQQSSHWFG